MNHTNIDSSSPQPDDWDDDDDDRDDLDDLIAEIAKRHPEFPAMVEAAVEERRALRAHGIDPNDLPSDAEGEEDEQQTTASQPATPHQA